MSQHTPSTPSDALVRRFPFFYGWAMVAVAAFLYYISGPGQAYNVAVFVDPMLGELTWSRTSLSGVYSLATLGAGAATVLRRCSWAVCWTGLATGG